MMATRRCTALLLGCVAFVAGCQSAPRPVEQQAWIRLVSQHFEMWSGAPVETSRGLIEDLERFRSALILLEPPESEPSASIRIVAFGDARNFDEFRKSPEHPGISLPTLSGPVLLLDTSTPEPAFALRHAYLHATQRNRGESAEAAWYQEGRAEYLSQLELHTDSIGMGARPESLATSLRYGDPLPLRRLLGAGASRAGWSSGEHLRFRSQAWALTHLLRHQAQGTLGDRYATLADTVSRRRLRSKHAGANGNIDHGLENRQALFTEYLRQQAFASFQAPVALPGVAAVELTSEASASASALLLKVAREVDGSDELVARLRARASLGTRSGSPAALSAVLGDPAVAVSQLAASIEGFEKTPPSEAHEWTEIGDAWRTLASRDPELTRGRAAAAYQRALELDPNDIEATFGLAASMDASWEDHTAAAMLLRRAASVSPGVARIDLALSERLMEAGQPRRAAAVLERLANAPHVGAIVSADVLQAALDRTDLAEVDRRLWDSQLLIRTPLSGARLEQLAPWVEITGTAGLGESLLHDIIVLFDISELTLAPSGLDINGNGVVGRRIAELRIGSLPIRGPTERFPQSTRPGTTDRGDSILAAEKAVAAELVGLLDPTTTRVGVIAYANRPFGLVPLGPPEAAVAAIESFGGHRTPSSAGIHTGLIGALALLRSEQAAGPPRRSSVFLVAGSMPNQPSRRRARLRAHETARTLDELGVRIHTFSVGKRQRRLDQLLLGLSQATGGTHAPVRYANEAQLPSLEPALAGLETIEVTNHTSGATARAKRVFSDGSFDAIVPLVPGENRIEIVAVLPGRSPLRESRIVHYVVPEEPSSKHRRRAAVLLWELRNRSIEVATRLRIAEAQAKRASQPDGPAVQRTEVTIEVESAGPVDPGAAANPNVLDTREAAARGEIGAQEEADVAAPPRPPNER